MGPLRFMVLLNEYDGNRKEQSRYRLWEVSLPHGEEGKQKEGGWPSEAELAWSLD